MRKTIFTIAATLMLSVSAWSQTAKSVIIPGKGNIDVEQLNKKIDLKMDVSRLSLSEVRVLRNAFAARQGYCFFPVLLIAPMVMGINGVACTQAIADILSAVAIVPLGLAALKLIEAQKEKTTEN